MGIEIRLFLVLDAFCDFLEWFLARSAALSFLLTKQLLHSTAVVVGFSDRSTDAHVTSGSWRSLRNPRRAAMNYAVLRLRQHFKINRRGRSLFLETLQVFRSC